MSSYDPNNDLYKELGVSPKASAIEIKKAYRRLVKKHHPDISKKAGAEERFKAISNAYSILSDPDLRADYDLKRTSTGSSTNQRPSSSGSASGQKPPGGASQQPFWTTSGSQNPPPSGTGTSGSASGQRPPGGAGHQTYWTSASGARGYTGSGQWSPIPHPSNPRREMGNILFAIVAVAIGLVFLVDFFETDDNNVNASDASIMQANREKERQATVAVANAEAVRQEEAKASELKRAYGFVDYQMDLSNKGKLEYDRCQQISKTGKNCTVAESHVRDAATRVAQESEDYNAVASATDTSILDKYGYPAKLGPDGVGLTEEDKRRQAVLAAKIEAERDVDTRVREVQTVHNAVNEQLVLNDKNRATYNDCVAKSRGSYCDENLLYKITDGEIKLSWKVEDYNIVAWKKGTDFLAAYGFPLWLGADGQPVA